MVFLALINNIGVRNLKILWPYRRAQKGVNLLDFFQFSGNLLLLFWALLQGHNFFEISNPDIIVQHQKSAFSRFFFWLFFRISQKIADNSSYEKPRISEIFLQLLQSFWDCVKKSWRYLLYVKSYETSKNRTYFLKHPVFN